VWLEGDGFLDAEGRYYPEENIRAAVAVVAQFGEWFNALPDEVRRAIEELPR
jgi:hypothetical protein